MAVDAAKEIESSGKKARVVSAVCWELFEEQDEAYKNSVLPPDVTARVCRQSPFPSSLLYQHGCVRIFQRGLHACAPGGRVLGQGSASIVDMLLQLTHACANPS